MFFTYVSSQLVLILLEGIKSLTIFVYKVEKVDETYEAVLQHFPTSYTQLVARMLQ
jgi:hypothetical protein